MKSEPVEPVIVDKKELVEKRINDLCNSTHNSRILIVSAYSWMNLCRGAGK